MQLYEHTETISCPIDGKPKKVFCQSIEWRGSYFTRCFGCDVDMHGSAACTECATQITIKPIENPLDQSTSYRPYEE